jgi:hypothetical protein
MIPLGRGQHNIVRLWRAQRGSMLSLTAWGRI